MREQIGVLTQRLIDLLELTEEAGTPIYIGDSNEEHMEFSHPTDYALYREHLPEILRTPDYVAINPSDNSIEYVKEFEVNDKYVKAAVRVSNGGVFYARSLYTLNPNRVRSFIQKGTLKKY